MDRPLDTSAARESGAPMSRPLAAIDAVVVTPAPGQGAAYAMYQAQSMSAEGATLSGGLLLEKGEELLIELKLPDKGAVRVRVRVVEITPDEGTMRVAFVGLEEADRQRLSRTIAPPPHTAR